MAVNQTCSCNNGVLREIYFDCHTQQHDRLSADCRYATGHKTVQTRSCAAATGYLASSTSAAAVLQPQQTVTRQPSMRVGTRVQGTSACTDAHNRQRKNPPRDTDTPPHRISTLMVPRSLTKSNWQPIRYRLAECQANKSGQSSANTLCICCSSGV